MQVWLLQSRKGGRTCGHLHVRESGAWRCRDVQAEPGAWSVASAWLTAQDKRPEQDVWHVLALWFMVVMAPASAVLSAVALVAALAIQARELDHPIVFVCVLGLSFCVPASFVAVKWFRQDIGWPAIVARVLGR